MNRVQSARVLCSAAILALLATGLSACNTVEGAGKDVEALGRGTSDAARATGDAISK